MVGLVSWDTGKRVSSECIQVLGLPLLCVRVPAGGRWEKHRLGRAAKLLNRRGVRRVLVPKDFSHWNVLAGRGLSGVDVLPLYRTMADRLTLTLLKCRGVEPERSFVELRGEYVDGDMARAARLLCPRVRSVTVEAARGGERLMRELYWEFGAVAAARTADVTVRFGGTAQEGELVLCGKVPDLLGLELEVNGLELPEEFDTQPLITALWQAGRLSLEQLCVRLS